MADYEVNDFTETANSLAAVLALLEAKIEEYDDAKTIHYVDVFQIGQKWAYALVIKAQISWKLGIVSIADASLSLVTPIDVWNVSQNLVAGYTPKDNYKKVSGKLYILALLMYYGGSLADHGTTEINA